MGYPKKARPKLLLFVGLAWCAQSFAATTTDPFLYDKEVHISALSDRKITYYLDRPTAAHKVPLLIVVDGSGCIGQKRSALQNLFKPTPNSQRAYARIRVEKPGVASNSSDLTSPCTEEFSKNYSIDSRVLDHLRVLQHLKSSASWWNGDLLLWGWSDGGDIAAQIAIYYPNVKKSVLGAMGGGLTMAEQFEDILICPDSPAKPDRESCRNELRDQFSRIADYPTWKETWSGQDNSWRAWNSRLYSRLSNALPDVQSPFLVVHGEMDHESVPVESARKLINVLHESGNTHYTYWEIPDMKHGLNSLPATERKKIEDAMLHWLLSDDNDKAPPLDEI